MAEHRAGELDLADDLLAGELVRAGHDLDVFSLTTGLLAAVPAALYLLTDALGRELSGGLVAAVVAVDLGVAGLASAARRARR